MHTDKYNPTACAPRRTFQSNLPQIKSTRPGKRDGNEEVGRGKKKKTNSSDISFSSFSLSPLLFNSVQNTYTMILICCARMHRFDMKLCYSFTYLCAMQHISSDFNVYLKKNTQVRHFAMNSPSQNKKGGREGGPTVTDVLI